MDQTDNLRVEAFETIASPQDLRAALPITARTTQVVLAAREALRQALLGGELSELEAAQRDAAEQFSPMISIEGAQ